MLAAGERDRRRQAGFGRVGFLVLAVALLSCGAAAPPAHATDFATGATERADPVLRDVVRLLEARLGEDLILRWLEEGDRHPAPLEAGDLVALKRAGASDELVAALLDRVAVGEAPPTAPSSAPPDLQPIAAPSPPSTSSTPPAALEPAPSAPTAPAAPVLDPATSDARASGEVLAELAVRYVHVPEDGEGEPWRFVAYLDGAPTRMLEPSPRPDRAPTWTETRPLAPGRHVLRWALERHLEGKDGRAVHAARFDPEPMPFALGAEGAARIEVEFRDRSGWFARFGGPIDARVTQGGRELARRESDDDPGDWPLLCEEIEASLAGREPGFGDRRALRSCVRWAALWGDLPSIPDRDAARPELP